jgi:hypothetical protein
MNVDDHHYCEHHSLQLIPFHSYAACNTTMKNCNDIYIYAHSRVHFFFSLLTSHNLAFMLFVLPNLLIIEP